MLQAEKTEQFQDKRLTKIIPIFKGGTSIIDVEPVITPDSKLLLCGNGTKVRVYSIASGEIVNDLVGHSGVVTCVIIHPENQLQALSCALDKCIIRWDYTDAVMLQKYSLEVSLYCLLPWNPESFSYFGIYETSKVDTEGNKVYTASRFDLPKQRNNGETIRALRKQKYVSKEAKCASVGCKGDYVACATEHELRIIWFDPKKKKLFRGFTHVHKPQSLTCVSCHPTEYCIATGTSDGNIILWYDFLQSSHKPIRTLVHWHALPVLSLKFSPEGSYLLSGGHECVLVRWQIESLTKDFLPRLGSPITHIVSSRDASLTATCQADNGIQLISNSSNKVVQIYQGLTRTSLSGRTDCPIPAGMVIDPRTSSLVMNGNSGHIQFYSLHNDKQMYNLDIVGQNYVSPHDLSKPLVLTEVENIAFSDNGMWLATIERRDDKETTPESRLKFWIYLQDSQNYNLNTTVESPHSGKVRALKFRATGRDGSVMAVTTCKDGKFKLWSLVDDNDIYRSNQCWNCESVGFYKEFPAGPVDFSQDGSLLAVGFASTLTLWDPDTNGFRKYLSHLASGSHLRHVLFGHGSNSHMLLTANATTIVSWNLLSCSAQWSVQFSAKLLVADPQSDHFAAFEESGKLRVFKARRATAIFDESFPDHQILDAVFVPHKSVEETDIKWQKKSQLYFMNKEQLAIYKASAPFCPICLYQKEEIPNQLLTLGTKEDKEENERSSNVKLHQNLPETAFGRLLAKKRATGVVNPSFGRREGHKGQPGTEFIKELMGTPAHALPPVTSLCLSFMETLTLKTNSMVEEVDEAEEEEDNAKDVVQSDASDSEGEDENKRESKMDIDVAVKPSQIVHIPDSKPQRTYDKIQHEVFSWMENL